MQVEINNPANYLHRTKTTKNRQSFSSRQTSGNSSATVKNERMWYPSTGWHMTCNTNAGNLGAQCTLPNGLTVTARLLAEGKLTVATLHTLPVHLKRQGFRTPVPLHRQRPDPSPNNISLAQPSPCRSNRLVPSFSTPHSSSKLVLFPVIFPRYIKTYTSLALFSACESFHRQATVTTDAPASSSLSTFSLASCSSCIPFNFIKNHQ